MRLSEFNRARARRRVAVRLQARARGATARGLCRRLQHEADAKLAFAVGMQVRDPSDSGREERKGRSRDTNRDDSGRRSSLVCVDDETARRAASSLTRGLIVDTSPRTRARMTTTRPHDDGDDGDVMKVRVPR